ncbi:ABC transporter ATP-binding protein [Pigmentiphaga aceris]|uniref:ABC transporter ATP-binding protein n=1 Tax=Pigmentiphaga aceris TaxID=1940612 RepID=A0A5C0AXZ2_9BURK|nr:ABC transporter ATP-binding protein [Pigmentiphaga aceris]QEI06606.1 ABC transporter ATP-binding protein [Pigmentiphaga aceris]
MSEQINSITGTSDAPLLSVTDLGVAYDGGRIPVLSGVSFSLAAGRTLGVVGESGCGKSTLAQALVQLLPAGAVRTGGRIDFNGRELTALPETALRDIRGKDIAMILQDPLSSLNPLLRIGTQIAEVSQRHLKLPRRSAWDRARELLASVRLSEPAQRLREYPHQLSGGMRQRVAGAIALAASPKLLIADEPTTALDPTVQVQYLRLLKGLQREHGFSMVFITHDLGVVANICDEVAVMYAGRIVELGTTADIFKTPAHPYTRALLDSLPRIGERAGSLRAISGQPPRPGQVTGGCAFAPRCPHVMPKCREASPTLLASVAADLSLDSSVASSVASSPVPSSPASTATTRARRSLAACWLTQVPAEAHA